MCYLADVRHSADDMHIPDWALVIAGPLAVVLFSIGFSAYHNGTIKAPENYYLGQPLLNGTGSFLVLTLLDRLSRSGPDPSLDGLAA